MEYYLKMIHRSGFKHQAAEALSRLIADDTDDFDIEGDIPVIGVTTPGRSWQNRLYDSTPEKTLNEI